MKFAKKMEKLIDLIKVYQIKDRSIEKVTIYRGGINVHLNHRINFQESEWVHDKNNFKFYHVVGNITFFYFEVEK